jgi:hypothetical protein
MNKVNWRILVGVILLVMGGLTLLQSLNVLKLEGSIWGVVFAALFAAGGAAFLYVYLADRQQWWALIPGCSLIGLGGVISLPMIPGFPDALAPVFFLAMIGLSFLIIYLIDHKNWWGIIPAGALFSVAALIGLSTYHPMIGVGVMFLGLAATFAALAVLPTGEEHMTWPWIPALILLVMGIIFTFMQGSAGKYVWPAMLIVGGLFLIVRTVMAKKSS